ncbi:MAG: hypothetical protein ABSF32_07475 [Ignavibacteria bacterium]
MNSKAVLDFPLVGVTCPDHSAVTNNIYCHRTHREIIHMSFTSSIT